MTQKAHSFGDVLFSLQRKKREMQTSQTEKNVLTQAILQGIISSNREKQDSHTNHSTSNAFY